MERWENTWADFNATRWTLVGRARRDDEHSAAQAHPTALDAVLDQLGRTYWPPVYGYLRRIVLSREQATETTQAFFVDVVLGRRLFERADQDRGHLRSLILVSLRNFLTSAHRREVARGKGRTISLPGIDAEEERLGETHTEPEEAFARRWASGELDAALTDCRDHFVRSGKPKHWTIFESFVLAPSIGNSTPPSLASLAAEHGLAGPPDAAAVLQTVRRRLIAILKARIAGHSANPEAAELEYASLVQTLGASVGHNMLA